MPLIIIFLLSTIVPPSINGMMAYKKVERLFLSFSKNNKKATILTEIV